MCATSSSTSAALAAATICSASATFIAIGFSTSTALPAPMAASAWGACRWFGVADDDGVDARVGDERLPVGGDLLDAVLRGERLRAGEPVVGDADDAAEAGVLHRADVEIGDEAAAEDGDPQVGHGRKSRGPRRRRAGLRRPPNASRTVSSVLSTVRACSLAFVGFGLAAASLGPILPGVRDDLGLGDVGTGLAIAAAGAGWGSGVLASGRVSRARGRRTSFASGTTLLTFGLLLVAIAPVGAIVVLGSFVFSFGGGLLTGAANAALAELDDHSLAVANGFFGVGAITGPLMASALVGIGPGWRAVPAVAAVLCACTIPLARALPAGKLPPSPDRHGARRPAAASPLRAAGRGDRHRRRGGGGLRRLDRHLRRTRRAGGPTGSPPARRWRSGSASPSPAS